MPCASGTMPCASSSSAPLTYTQHHAPAAPPAVQPAPNPPLHPQGQPRQCRHPSNAHTQHSNPLQVLPGPHTYQIPSLPPHAHRQPTRQPTSRAPGPPLLSAPPTSHPMDSRSSVALPQHSSTPTSQRIHHSHPIGLPLLSNYPTGCQPARPQPSRQPAQISSSHHPQSTDPRSFRTLAATPTPSASCPWTGPHTHARRP